MVLTIALFVKSHAQTALEFDLVDDNVTTTNNLSLSSYTQEAWVLWDGNTVTAENNTIIGGNDTNKHILWIVSGTVYVGNDGNEFVVIDENPMPVGVWTHFAVSYDGATGNMRLYRNGVPTGTPLGFSNVGFTLTDINLGRFNVPANKEHLFGGMIDDVRIWDSVRTPAEIAANYDQCLLGTEAGLAAFYNFEDGTGSTTLTDVTGNGNDGTLVNMDAATDWVTGQGSCNTLSVTDNLSISDIIKVYPNPTSDLIHIESVNAIDSIELFDVLGKRVLTFKNDVEKVSVSHLQRGVYILKVYSSQGNLTKKLIIE